MSSHFEIYSAPKRVNVCTGCLKSGKVQKPVARVLP
jgi:hypothetical protein